MKAKKLLAKKWHGVPVVLLLALVATAVAGALIYSVLVTVKYPKSEQLSVEVEVASGYSFEKTADLDLVLPAEYKLTYTFTGDEGDILADEKAHIWIDVDGDGQEEDGEFVDLSLGESGSIIVPQGNWVQHITVSATARDGTLAVVEYVEGTQTLEPATNSAVLTVDMVPTKP